MQELLTRYLSPSKPHVVPHYNSQPPSDNPTNMTEENSATLYTAPQPPVHPPSVSFLDKSDPRLANPVVQPLFSAPTTKPVVISPPTATLATPSHACGETPPTSTPPDGLALLQSVQAILERMLRRLDAQLSAPAFTPLPLPVEISIDKTASVLATLLSSHVGPTFLLQSSPSPPPLPQFTTALVSSDVAPTPLPLSSTLPSPRPHPVSSLSRIAKVWSMTEVKKVSAPKGLTKRADVAFSPINLPLAATRVDKNRSLWDVETGEVRCTTFEFSGIFHMCSCPQA